jgi:hypothetical protein
MRSNENKKMRSRSEAGSINTILATDSMKYSVSVLLLVLALASGCSLFAHKSKKAGPKELPPAAEIEAEFRDRWIDRQIHELLLAHSAKTEDEARAMASAEFVKQYPFIRPSMAKNSR